MVWFSTEYRREALIMVALVLHWSNIEEVSAISGVNTDEAPCPVLNNLYLDETTGPVQINLTTIDSRSTVLLRDEYTEVSLELIPASSEIESLEFNGTDNSSLEINITTYSIIVSGMGSKEDYNDIFSDVIYCWNSTNGNLASGNLTLTVTDYLGFTGNVIVNIFVEDVEDDNPIFGFASDNVNRTSLLYPMTLATSKVIDYNTAEPVYFLNDIYLRDDGQVKNISVEVAVSATDRLSWNQEYNSTNNASIMLYTFTDNISDVLQWEMFLMSFNFCQSAIRPADRNINSNRTINVTVQDCSNTSTVTVIINVLPLPPEVTITVQNTTFVEGHDFILLRRNLSIVVIQDPDALFVSLTVTLQIGEEGTYELGATEMLNTVTSPTELQAKNLNENDTAHMIIFSNPEGISDEVATQAIQSVIYLNFDNEPLAFDDTGAPLLRKITISTVDTLSRTFQKSFYIRIQPVNDNPPVIRLFTSGNCSSNSTKSLPAMRQKRTTSPQLSQRVKHHNTIQQERQMQAPRITEIYGDLTDNNCAAYIVIHFSAPVSHPYVDIWPRLSLVLSLSPQYLSDQRPTGAWDGQSTLIITFPDHNCSEWNYNNSHIIFKQSNDPCHSLIECLTGICYSNYSGCRITGTFAFNFTTDHDRQATAVDCLYSPTSAPLLADTWTINILVATVVLLLATIFFYCIWKYVSKKLHVPEEDTAQKTVVRGQPSWSRKHNRKKASHKSSTIAQIAAKQQQVNDVNSITEKMSHDYHHGDCDHILATDKDDVCNNHSPVEEIGFDKDALMGSKYQVARELMDHNVTIAHDTTTTSDSSHHTMHSNTTDTPRRPAVNDSAFPPDTT